MKIPKGYATTNEMWKFWRKTAAKIGLKYDIFVGIGYELDQYQVVIRIYFICAGHEFETLSELKKALKLKAFL